MDLKGFWRWCMLYRIHRIFLDFFHRPVFQKTRRFGNWICFRPQVKVGEKTPTQLGPLERANLNPVIGDWKKSRKILWILSLQCSQYLPTGPYTELDESGIYCISLISEFSLSQHLWIDRNFRVIQNKYFRYLKFPYTCYTSCPSNPAWYGRPNNISLQLLGFWTSSIVQYSRK
jgi:hypothetical protein